ncbi:MAG: ABC transporter ATP-binding protein/permease [Gordonibacter sp.]|nr:ABC transporter ATP-binding protein/permease [Gordonibacter sp.]
MLQLTSIRKEYTTYAFTQVALDDVSVSFRDNEFVAILGPSGSGKTTLLNIVGGLDHYDSGNLIIDGISTEEYKDRDWDAYRNNRIGFVFQSYNLIPHQTILANVELALTLSGVSRAERHERAKKALEDVGLGEHINKKPSQLSGGQMQRVAIARALINDPEILLADEPTGALDSKTSVQVMDLLTEIAKDRLVIMVTHNPELAEQYANRIVNLSDGVVQSDTNPFDPTTEEMHKSEKPVRKTGMSFFTALALSFNNLMTKKGRTLMTAFAGSIGIIGIAAILALANGVNNYIKSVEEDTLSEYPLSIESQGFDLTSMMVMPDDASKDEATGKDTNGDNKQVSEFKMLTNMFSKIGSNDLASLKQYFDEDGGGIEQYVNSIQYTYSVTPQIYSANTTDGVRQVNPDKSFSALGLGSSNSSNSLMSMSMSTDVFAEMVDDTRLVENQYDVVAGRWPESYNEIILVLNSRGGMSDLLFYDMGLRNPNELDDMVSKLANNEDVVTPEDTRSASYDEILNTSFKLVNSFDYYQYDAEYNVWKDKSGDETFMKDLVNKGTDLKITGIIQPKPDATATALSTGLYYTPALTDHLINSAASAPIVKDQLATPNINVFSGKTFSEEENEQGNGSFDMSSLFTINETALQSAFTIDQSALAVDMSNALNLQGAMTNAPAVPEPDMNALLGTINIDIPQDKVNALVAQVAAGYPGYCIANGLNPVDIQTNFPLYLQSAEAQGIIMGGLQGLVDTEDLKAQVGTALQGYAQTTMTTYMNQLAGAIQSQVTSALQQSMNQMATNMASAMHIDPEAFKNVFQMNMSEKELTELMMSLMQTEKSSYDNNLKKLGYADLAKPASIDIYPIDFESKEHVIDILDAYNETMRSEGHDDKVITYTDIVGTLMASVTDIVNMVSYVLVAFVAISLVVSSIMIGVITYISVLERKKEIGILRSIGASKGDISRVFNAETLIVGFVAGAIGIGVTALACIPANAIVYSIFDVANVASLPWQAALILIAISMGLTFLAGLIPSSAASRKDPVEALRSE